MEFGKKQPMVLYLLRNRFDLYSEAQATIFHFDLTPYVANLEPFDKPNLEQQIKNFVDQNKIILGNITIVLGEDALFVKAIPPDTKDEDEEIQKFIDSVPFERVTHMNYVIEQGKLIVATNRDFYTAIKHVFENLGFSTSFIIPIFSTNLTIDPNTGLDENSARIILKNTQVPITQTFENSQEARISTPKPINPPSQKADKKRLYSLIGVFGILILILVAVIISSMNQATSEQENVVNQNPTPTISPTSPPVPEIPIGSSSATDSSAPTSPPLSPK